MPEQPREMSGKELVPVSGVTDRSHEGGMSEREIEVSKEKVFGDQFERVEGEDRPPVEEPNVIEGEFVEADEVPSSQKRERAGGGAKVENWQRFVDSANKLPEVKARHVLYGQARQALTS